MIMGLLLLAGCDSGEDKDFFSDDAQMPVTIETSLDADIIQTRANVSSGSMGVFLGNANGYKPQYNVQYTFNVGWKASAPVLVGAPSATLHAYYPYNVVTFTANSTTCTLTAQKYDAAKELYYAKASSSTVNNKTPNATFAMTRAYSRLKLSIKRHATNYVGNCNITNVNIKHSTGNNFFVSRTLDISTGTNGGSATANGWTYALNTGNMAANATNTAYDVLVPPQPVSGGLTITLTIDGVNRAVTVPAAQFSNNLNAGQQYTISLLVINDAELVLPASAVTVNDWGGVSNQDTDAGV